MKQYPLKHPTHPPQADPREPRFTIKYEEDLNMAQLAVVMTLEGPILVIAGAGSGKTRTLVYRVARLIESGVPPQRILLLTFTRRAAQEMLKRAGLLLQASCDRVSGGTFHSTANALLRKYGEAIGLGSSFTILDRSDAEDVIHLLRTSHGYNEKERRFPRKNTLAEIFSQSVNKMLPLEEVVMEDYSHFSQHIPDLVQLEKLYTHYKRQRMLLDYDDLLVRLLELLETQPSVRRRLSEAYQYILVDEYQDTNKIQARIIRLLCDTHENIMVVGDDAQSIYSFRGANFRNIMDFPKEFPATRIFRLEENYRSIQPILDLTNEIINRAKEKYPKHLFTRKGDGRLPALVQAESENFQSRFVCEKILELREEGVSLSDIAVLFRSSFHAFDLEIELARCNVPFVKRGGFKFIETAHVKDVLAHLRILTNSLDAVSWMRLLLLIEGVGPKKAHAIIGTISKEGDPLKALKNLIPRYPNEIQRGLMDLVKALEAATEDHMTPSEQIGFLYHYYFPILQRKYDDYPKRMKDLEHLHTITGRYQRLPEFLADMALEPPDESVSDVAGLDREDEKLVLSTIHSAKGLEWHTVFIIWALDGKFPSAYSFMTDEELEEERRLLYVAATRAKQGLFITYPINVYDKVLGSVLSKPTRFLDDIPKDYYDTWSLIEEGF
ncbi:MAG TPA: ATP-dependent helicase [Nitrospiria bacterium]|nr:ATP-dependent helicase [Nitrospiria bacterium]